MLRSLALAGVLVTTIGCASVRVDRAYQGDPRPRSEIAVLAVPSPIDVLLVNGESLPGSSIFSSAERREIELLPGPVEAVVQYYSPYDENPETSRSDRLLLRFDAKADHVYDVQYKVGRTRSQTRIWVTEGNQPVADLPADAIPAESEGLSNLKRAWRNASEADRAAFLEWSSKP